MDFLVTVFYAAITLGLLIAIHEFGHFWVARRCGVHVLKFSIGFGPTLLGWTGRTGTRYVLAAIPLGGFVKMAGESPDEPSVGDESTWFNRKTVAQRFAIVAAGPLINLLLAAVVFFVLSLRGEVGLAPIIGSYESPNAEASIALESGQEIIKVDGEEVRTWQEVSMALLQRAGETGTIRFELQYPESNVVYDSQIEVENFLSEGEISDPLAELGITPWSPPLKIVVASLVDGGAASNAGLQVGDEIASLNDVYHTDFRAWLNVIESSPGETLVAGVKRGDDFLELPVQVQSVETEAGTVGRIGIGIEPIRYPENMIRRYHYSVIESLSIGVERTLDTSIFIFESLVKMISGQISVKNLSGPITIAKVATDSAQNGFYAWLSLLALLSVSLGVLNLLPIPVLDGGHLLFYAIEAIKGSPVSERIQQFGLQLGVVLLLGVTILAVYNDIVRLG